MKTSDIAKGFNCVAFKRRAQAKIYQEIRDLAAEEEVAYFREAASAGPFAEWWAALTRRRRARRRNGARS